jgi:hypothetical protein
MTSSIIPLTDVSPDLLIDFLHRVGVSRAVAEWRYFDARFNRGRNRGFAWIPHGRVEGFIGLIPFQVGDGGGVEANWSCDWVVGDASIKPGIGIVLLKRAVEESRWLFALGGNTTTQRLLPRLARRTVLDAAVTMHLPLRVGVLLRQLGRHRVFGRLPLPAAAGKIPLRFVRRSGRERTVRSEPGVASAIAGLLARDRAGRCAPLYDYEYVDWQIGRSPVLVAHTSLSPADGEPKAAAVYWRPRASADLWRMALWTAPGAAEPAAAVVREVVSRVYETGGMVLSTIVSRSDADQRALLRAAHFVARGTRPLYQCVGSGGPPLGCDLGGLSYLDTDLAYRF